MNVLVYYIFFQRNHMRLILLCRIRLDFPLIIHRWYFLYDKVRKTNNSVFDFLPQSINFYSSIIMENMIHSFFLPLRMLIYMCICFTCYCLAYQAWRIGIRISPSSFHYQVPLYTLQITEKAIECYRTCLPFFYFNDSESSRVTIDKLKIKYVDIFVIDDSTVTINTTSCI